MHFICSEKFVLDICSENLDPKILEIFHDGGRFFKLRIMGCS